MENVSSDTPAQIQSQAQSFNFNKLQAVACITASAAASVGLIYWVFQTVF